MQFEPLEFYQRLDIFIKFVFPNITQTNLAVKLELNKTQFSKYRTGDTVPSLQQIGKFSKLGVSLDWLINGKENIFSLNNFGEKAKRYFFNNINQETPETLKMSDSILLNKLLELFGSKEMFYDFLDAKNIDYSKTEFCNIIDINQNTSLVLEQIFSKIKFYYYIEQKLSKEMFFSLNSFLDNIEKYENKTRNNDIRIAVKTLENILKEFKNEL